MSRLWVEVPGRGARVGGRAGGSPHHGVPYRRRHAGGGGASNAMYGSGVGGLRVELHIEVLPADITTLFRAVSPSPLGGGVRRLGSGSVCSREDGTPHSPSLRTPYPILGLFLHTRTHTAQFAPSLIPAPAPLFVMPH